MQMETGSDKRRSIHANMHTYIYLYTYTYRPCTNTQAPKTTIYRPPHENGERHAHTHIHQYIHNPVKTETGGNDRRGAARRHRRRQPEAARHRSATGRGRLGVGRTYAHRLSPASPGIISAHLRSLVHFNPHLYCASLWSRPHPPTPLRSSCYPTSCASVCVCTCARVCVCACEVHVFMFMDMFVGCVDTSLLHGRRWYAL